LGSGPKIGIISDFDERLPSILSELGVASYFDFIITSQQAKADKTKKSLFDLALGKAGLTSAESAYHLGVQSQDIEGAASAGWKPLRFTEWFDDTFPDWTIKDSEEDAATGADRSAKVMSWGRKDTTTGVEWIELWGLDDLLTIFGFPEDPNKPIKTTYIRNVLTDE
jgi:phosphoglycolate phosphatase-like HAD superfamily hydrolase